jgi:ATP-binding cassette subfamily B protein
VSARRRWLAFEVVQSSDMDCGPAALKCLLEGHGIPVSYGRLREACQTDVDGTSIDALEELANAMGLVAEQVLIPPDHLLLDGAAALPAIVVESGPLGMTHFVVAWRRHRGLVQVMDPASGRVWTGERAFRDGVHLHEMAVSAAAFCEWARTGDFLRPLKARMRRLRLPADLTARRLDAALSQGHWKGFAALDAAVRFTQSLVDARALRPGARAAVFLEEVLACSEGETSAIPGAHWFARSAGTNDDGDELVSIRGAILVRAKGAKAAAPGAGAAPLPAEIEAALHQEPTRPWRVLLELARTSSRLGAAALAVGFAVAAFAVVVESLLFRAVLGLDRLLGLTAHRLVAAAALVGFLVLGATLELPLVAAMLRAGRQLEARLRVAFLEKLARLGDHYFRSRLTSDLAERSHMVHTVREVPALLSGFVRIAFQLLLTVAGVVWLDLPSALPAISTALAGLFLPLAVQPLLAEADLRVRSHAGALSRFYLDALRGIVPVRAHAAQRALAREHEALLVEWMRAARHLLRWSISSEALVRISGLGLVVWLIGAYAARTGEASAALLLTYWALQLPALGYELALVVRQYPARRNVTLRLVETLGATEPARASEEGGARERRCPAAEIRIEGVSVRAGGHTILEGISTAIASGERVAVVGPSGAGKSTLVRLLLGLGTPSTGRLVVDGRPFEAQRDALLQRTAWVDPEVHLWNRSLEENLRYGNPGASMGPAVVEADLREILAHLPEGSRTVLGEGGALVSGGEGQRVRVGRALLRGEPRLVVLDEPFRGLERAQRRLLLERCLRAWKGATLLLVTHDPESALELDRVIVMDSGRIVEEGVPAVLADREGSRLRAALGSFRTAREGLGADGRWRRWRLEAGRLRGDVEEIA